MGTWFLIRYQPGRYKWASDNIGRQGHEPYCPMISEQVLTGRAGRKVLTDVINPLFPSYMFCSTRDGQWRFLTGTFGVQSVVMLHDGPVIVPERVITYIRQLESNGLIVLPARPAIRVGEKVRMTKGTFTDEIGIYNGMVSTQRVEILMEAMGRKVSLRVAPDTFEPA